MKLNRKFDNEINDDDIVRQRRCRNRHQFFVKFVFFNLMKLTNETMFQIRNQLSKKNFDVNQIDKFNVRSIMFNINTIVMNHLQNVLNAIVENA